MKNYDPQVKLLIECLPTIASIDSFVLKGGTAINLFVLEELPRLSVDIDLIYLPLQSREESLLGIEKGLLAIQKQLIKLPRVTVRSHKNQQTQTMTSLIVAKDLVQIKIEPNLVLRGTVYPPLKRDLSKSVERRYGLSVLNMPTAAIPDLYGGKICAALDRQHPRDLFDVKQLLKTGITEEIKKAFLVYLASHNRPMHELLQPNRLDLRELYQQEFVGMTTTNTTLQALVKVREQLINTLLTSLTSHDKKFLLGIKQGVVHSEALGLPGIEQLPGIRWKLLNIAKMDKEARLQALAKLAKVLGE